MTTMFTRNYSTVSPNMSASSNGIPPSLQAFPSNLATSTSVASTSASQLVFSRSPHLQQQQTQQQQNQFLPQQQQYQMMNGNSRLVGSQISVSNTANSVYPSQTILQQQQQRVHIHHQQIASSISPLILLKQSCSSNEEISINGLLKTVFVVVKNAPFSLYMTVNPVFAQLYLQQYGIKFDLNDFVFDAVLHYDRAQNEDSGVASNGVAAAALDASSAVDYVKSKPVEFKTTITGGSGGNHGNLSSSTNNLEDSQHQQVNIEMKLKVLSSQHNGAFFRVKLQLQNKEDQSPVGAPLICESLRVISKPDGVKSKKPALKKPNTSEILEDSLARIEQQQIHQIEFLKQIISNISPNQSTPSSFNHIEQVQVQQNPIQQHQNQNLNQRLNVPNMNLHSNPATPFSMLLMSQTDLQTDSFNNNNNSNNNTNNNSKKRKMDFEGSFRGFLRMFNEIESEERPRKIHRLLKSTGLKQTEIFAEILDAFLQEGTQKSDDASMENLTQPLQSNNSLLPHQHQQQRLPMSKPKNPTLCQCSTCPYQQELEQIEDFYKELLMVPFESNQQDDPLY